MADVRSGRPALFLLCAAAFMAVADTTIVSIALPSIKRELGFSGADAQWILNGYALAFGGLLLLCGRAGDLYGRRRLFLAGLAVFGVASLVGGLAPSPWLLVAARFLQGAGGAALVPASLSLLTSVFAEGEERNRAIGVYGAMAALGFVVGMVGGGVITELLGWRWVMFVNVPVALAVFVLTPLAVPESGGSGARRPLDAPGAAAATLGLASLIYAVSEVPEVGWASPATLGFGTAGALLLIAFVAAEKRSPAPLVPLLVFRERDVVVPNAAIALQSMVGIAWLYVLTLYFQEVLGHGPLAAGLLFAPMTGISLIAAPAAGRLATVLGVRPTAAGGLALLGAGLLLMTRMSEGGGLAAVLCGTVMGEFGFMLSNVPLTIAASGSTHERGLASGLMNTSIQLGSTLGLAAVATVAALGASPVGGLRSGLFLCVAIVVLALSTVVFGLRGEAGKEPLPAHGSRARSERAPRR